MKIVLFSDFEDLHPAGRLLHGKPLLIQHVYNEIAKGFDAAMMIGQHAMCGIETGNLNHTQCQATIEYYKLNGRLIGEIAQAIIAKAQGYPYSPVKWPGPYVLEKRFLFSDTADFLAANPLYERIDHKTVLLRSEDLLKILYS